jgi:hypothetical protein
MIDVWLKVRNRGNDWFVIRNLTFWLGMFSDREKYRIWIYNEDAKLPEYYNIYPIITRHSSLQKKECMELKNIIEKESAIIDNKWRMTAYALALPYFYLDDAEYIWNIDADDMFWYGSPEYFLDEALNKLKEYKISTLSHDWLYSVNADSRTLPHHWTFGINIGNARDMKNICINILKDKARYGYHIINLDFLVDKYLERTNAQYVCFVSEFDLSDNAWTIRFNKNINKIECGFFDQKKIFTGNIHPKTIMIK